MPKLFRRTWERQRFGRAGAISSPLSARTGTDGAISSAAFATPVKVFTSATASFVAGDVGRKIRLSGTPSNRYDGLYVIDSVNSGTSVNLRHNHNVAGTPVSDARFYENGSSITWKILESCTFTADSSGDIEDFYPGSYLYVDSGNTANRGLWLISHRVDSQTVYLCKSYVWWVADNNPFTVYAIDAATDFQAESGLRWYVIDRQPMSVPDHNELLIQFCIDAGWSLWQQRGHSTTLATYRDVVLKSTGETDALIPGGKTMFLRIAMAATRSGSMAVNAGGIGTSFAVYQHWDPTLTATAPGQGSGGCRGSSNANSLNTANGGGTALVPGSGFPWNVAPWKPGATSWLERGRGDIPDSSTFWDYSWFGDADEICLNENEHTMGPSAQSYVRGSFGHFKTMGSNPNVVTVTNAVTSGANKDLNVGSVDVTTLTPPYAVGDNITLVGRKTASPAEYVETTTIVSFDNTDVSNRLVRVAAISMAFGNGPDTLKLQIGEDPYPVACVQSQTTTFTPYLQNLAKLANATSVLGSPGRDFDATNFGSSSTSFEIYSAGFDNQDPNRKTGKHGLLAVGIRNDTNGEFRGRWRYRWDAPDYKWAMGVKFIVNGTDVYVGVSPAAAGISQVCGPMTKAMAGIYT